MATYNIMQTVKRHFFAMRNGVIADAIRKGGLDYKIIFGLNLPQLAEIAAQLEHSAGLGAMLWSDRRTRESMLLAPMVYPVEDMNRTTAGKWLAEACTTEVADVLWMKLLRRHPDALDMAIEGVADVSPMKRYTSLRLMLNLVLINGASVAGVVLPFAEAEAAVSDPLTRGVAKQLADECRELLQM